MWESHFETIAPKTVDDLKSPRFRCSTGWRTEGNMSHVTVTQTTKNVTTTSAILLNTGYLKTTSGILKILQLILGCVIVRLVAHYFVRSNPYYFTAELFLLLIATTCLIRTTCLLISCLLSISTATIIAKTRFELVYNGIAF
ncbi:hypothetical protein DAPPUDRAFT_333179 [Daphnia pulex]|uniref:Uncharacterized protein n=1 Tax=Daphnia pulex TaxID=6669 RepID=E9HS38_DAPPU|nr:hypothetical protein DAPPUDRAFT_333179 [Daphnia pulex]|eukprot:EFX65454.1 hypothetical protein DAPPUDRAFT_333179 [Daphnia pulex]